jgi:hypothetical protein
MSTAKEPKQFRPRLTNRQSPRALGLLSECRACEGLLVNGSKANVSSPARLTLSEEDLVVKKKRFSVEQIVTVLKEAEPGTPVADLIRKV